MIDARPGEWTRISTNTLADVLAKVGGKYLTVAKGGSDPTTGQFAWSGASFDSDLGRVFMDADGGHGDGADNGAYDFDVASGLFAMRRAPTADLIPTTQQPTLAVYRDAAGKQFKAARHNYGGQVYMPSVKRHWQGSGVVWWNSGTAGRMSWETAPDGASVPSDDFGIGSGLTGDNTSPDIQSAWDSIAKRVLYCDHGRLRAYDPAKPAGSRVSGVDADEGNGLSDGRHRDMSPLYDPKRNRFVMFGSFEEGITCLVWEPVAGGAFRRRVQALTPAALNAKYALGVAPLVAYDPISDRYAIHAGGRGLLIVNPDTWAVVDATPTAGGDPGPPHPTGTYNRGGYWPAQDVLVVVHSVSGGAWAYRRPSGGTSPPVVVEPPIVIPPTPTVPGLTDRVFLARPQPPRGSGVAAEMKHCTELYVPPMGRVLVVGGDYDGGSYDQRVWSRGTRTLIDSTDPRAAWKLEFPFCAPAGVTAMPKSPDHVGAAWDASRSLVWHVPGQYNPPSLPVQCPGITQDGADNGPYKYGHLMQYKPLEADVTRRWVDLGTNYGPDFEGTWMTVRDEARDRLVRFGSRGSGVVNYLNCATLAWSAQSLLTVGHFTDDRTIRLTKEYLALDAEGGAIYAIDGIAGKLYRYELATDRMVDLGPVPGGSLSSENLTLIVWDSWNHVLLYHRFGSSLFAAYHPDTATWETIPIVTDPPGTPFQPRCAVFDPSVGVSVWSGGKVDGGALPNPPLFVFRYAAGTAPVPPIEPPPIITPPVKPVVKVTIERPAGVDVTVNVVLVP